MPPLPPVAAADAGESARAVHASFGMTVASRYLFQGLDYSDGHPVAQPEVELEASGLAVSLWANRDLERNVIDEIDTTVRYQRRFPSLSACAGYTSLRYPHRPGWDPSQEVFLDLSTDLLFEPALSIHADVEGGGVYSTFSVSHQFESRFAAATLDAALYHQAHYDDVSGVPSIELGASLERGLGPVDASARLSRTVAWENGGFRGENRVASNWLVSFGLSGSC